VHVLVGGALGAAVRRVEIERLRLSYAIWEIGILVATVPLHDHGFFHSAIDLVRRSEDQECFGATFTHRFEQVEGSEDVALEVLARISHRGSHGYLAGAVKDHVETIGSHGLEDLAGEPEIEFGELEIATASQPLEIPLSAAARKIIPDRYFPAGLHEASRSIYADEAGPSGDENTMLLHAVLVGC
jgi:hypothetical protein